MAYIHGVHIFMEFIMEFMNGRDVTGEATYRVNQK